jgi:hypothetical protein
LSQARPFADTWILRGSGATANTKQIIDDLPHANAAAPPTLPVSWPPAGPCGPPSRPRLPTGGRRLPSAPNHAKSSFSFFLNILKCSCRTWIPPQKRLSANPRRQLRGKDSPFQISHFAFIPAPLWAVGSFGSVRHMPASARNEHMARLAPV